MVASLFGRRRSLRPGIVAARAPCLPLYLHCAIVRLEISVLLQSLDDFTTIRPGIV
jgi:hypothetical protein